MQTTRENLVAISVTQWQRASETLRECSTKEPKKKWIRHFRYDLQAGKISSWQAKEASSLFFEYEACSGVKINDFYILFELSDGTEDVDGFKYQSFKYQNDPQRELILRRGIIAEDYVYSLIGASNSGVQAHSYVFRRGSLDENERLMLSLMPNLRNLELSKGAGKRIKYQGLMFSGAQVMDLPESGVRIQEIASVERTRSSDGRTYDFTDGCGLISLKLARYLQKKARSLGVSKKTEGSGLPSVFHIRYAGKIERGLKQGSHCHICKGVLLVDYRNDQTYEISVRKSMLKEEVSVACANILGGKIGIIDRSKESPGRLSQQLICLLTASVPGKIIEDMQQQHLNAVDTATTTPLSAAWLAGLEPKSSAWYAIQGLFFAAARENQSASLLISAEHSDNAKEDNNRSLVINYAGLDAKCKSNDETPNNYAPSSKPIPNAYFMCTSGRSHPRRFSDNLTKVQIPLACCRTFFGAAFPEILASSSNRSDNCIREGECIVMLEDGPLVDEIVIVSRSPSYHPGDVRVLRNRASQLPLSHPVCQLRNCILFSTDGARPDADKMGGGDLDGDRFLIVWDSRLVKYSDEIQRFEAPEYDTVYCDSEKRNTDWIHQAAMLDSVMLGAIENSYYALAKEFGVTSDEIHQLNQLFSQLIDRKPAAIESFETLCRKAYNPRQATKSLNDESPDTTLSQRALWERLIAKQRKLLLKVRKRTASKFDDYNIFRKNLQKLCDLQTFDATLNDVQFHFGGCLQKKRARITFQKFRELVSSNQLQYGRLISQFRGEPAESLVTNAEFLNRLKSIALEAETELSKHLATLRTEQNKLLGAIKHQKTLYKKILDSFDRGEIVSITETVYSCRRIRAHILPKLTEAKDNLTYHKKILLQKKLYLHQCSSDLNNLKNQEIELSSALKRHDSVVESLTHLKHETTQYATDLGVQKFVFCGSFLGQEQHNLLSHDSFTVIHSLVLDFTKALSNARNILSSESLCGLHSFDPIDLKESWAHHCHHIEMLQETYSAAKSVNDLSQSNQSCALELLRDVSLTFEQRCIVEDLLEKCNALVSACSLGLNEGTSAFKSCLLHSDIAQFMDKIEQYPSLASLSTSMRRKVAEIDKLPSDVNRFQQYYRIFTVFLTELSVHEKHAAIKKRKAKSKLQKVSNKLKEQSMLKDETDALEKLTSSLESDIKVMTSKLESTYSPDDVKQTESDLADINAYKESIQLSIAHIHHKLDTFTTVWKRRANEDETRRYSTLRGIEDELKRVCAVEIYRTVGRSGGPLPVFKKRAELNRLIATNDAVIITAQTGSGKSTQVPQYIVDDSYTWIVKDKTSIDYSRNHMFRLCCTQPRRFAARSIAERVAKEFHTQLGDKVGFRVGNRDGVAVDDNKRISDDTEIEYVTEGLLLAQLRGSPERIKNYDVIIIDEAHERNIETDLLLSFLRNHLRRLKNDPQAGDIPLKVLVMSASIDWKRFCAYFDNCPRMDCPGQLFHVKELYRPIYKTDDLSEHESDGLSLSSSSIRDNFLHQNLPVQVDSIVPHATSVLFSDIICTEEEEGDVVIFFSGSREILQCVDSINKRAECENLSVIAYPLYSCMDEESKNAAKDPTHRTGIDGEAKSFSAQYVRKVICCTNIAETSVTIDRVRFVIDAGMAKKMKYNHGLRTMTLREEFIARASTKQRRGRAGRTQTGFCYYLYSKRTHDQMEEYELPKILQTPVESLILYSMHNCQCSIEELGLLDSPNLEIIETAKGRLEDLGFVTYADKERRRALRLTEDGEIAGILSSMTPESVRMVLWANKIVPIHRKKVMTMAALLSVDDDIFIGQRKVSTELSEKNGFSNTRSSSIQLVRNESEQYACEVDQGINQLGDHFLLLRAFESFERERRRSLKRTGNAALRTWCKKRGLNYSALNQAQLLMERCHNELKKRKILSEQRVHAGSDVGINNARTKEWSSDEAVIRAMITGYFHQLVESLNPLLSDSRAEFIVLSPEDHLRFKLKLDRDSCIWRLVSNKSLTDSIDYIPDDEDRENDAENFMPIEEKLVTFTFLLFTRLQSIVIKPSGQELVFMQGATAIDVKWICEQAPALWLDRIDINPTKSNITCGVIRNIGPKILRAISSHMHQIKRETDFKTIELSIEHGQVLICGSQASVVHTKETIVSRINAIISEFYKRDEKSVSVISIGRFGSGLELQTLGEDNAYKSTSEKYKGWQQLKEPPKQDFSGCREPISIKPALKSNREILDVYVKSGWDSHLFLDGFNRVVSTFNNVNKGCCNFVLAPPGQNSVKFSFHLKFDTDGTLPDVAKQFSCKRKKRNKSARKRQPTVQNGDCPNVATGQATNSLSSDECFNVIKSMIAASVSEDMNVLRVDKLPIDKLPVILALARESQLQSQFWMSHFPNIQFSPSYGCFEMFNCTSEELVQRISTLSASKTKLSITDTAPKPPRSELSSIVADGHHFTRSELCRFSANLEELRKSHPSVLWVASYKILPVAGALPKTEKEEVMINGAYDDLDASRDVLSIKEITIPCLGERNHCQENNVAETSIAQTEIGTIGHRSPSIWFQSDYQRLLAAYDNRLQDGPVIGLSVTLYSFSTSKPLKAISDCRSRFQSFFLDARLLKELIPKSSERGTEHKVCVMCRRPIQIRFRGSSEGKRSNLQGHRLTVCGCAYCRECFRASAEQFLDDGESVQCRNCKRVVLARDDCQQIVGPNYKEMKNDPYQQTLFKTQQKEWMNLLNKAEGKYCAEILVGGGDFSRFHTCPDCGAHSVFHSSKPYFRCSYINCTNVFCSRCLRVSLSLSDEERQVCADGKCQQDEEND